MTLLASKLLLNIPDKDSERIEVLVQAGEYASKSEFIRFAIKQALYSDDRMEEFKAISSKLQKQTKSRKQVKEETEWAKAGTRKTVEKMLKQ